MSIKRVLVCSIFVSFNMWDIATCDVNVLFLCKEKNLVICFLVPRNMFSCAINNISLMH